MLKYETVAVQYVMQLYRQKSETVVVSYRNYFILMNFDSNVRVISAGYPANSMDGKSLNLIHKLLKELDSLDTEIYDVTATFTSEEIYRQKLAIYYQLGYEFYDRKSYADAKM